MLIMGALGVFVGLILGLTGAGGGIFAVPALVLGMHWSMTQAAPVALIAVGLAALTGAIDGLKKGQTRYKAACLMALSGTATAPVGLYLARLLPEYFLMLLFSLIMLVISYRMLKPFFNRPSPNHSVSQKPCRLDKHSGKFIWTQSCLFTITCIGSTTGFFTGLLGVGGGFLIVPALQRYTQLSIHSIVSTSLMVIALVSANTVLFALWRDPVFPGGTWSFVILVVLGMVAGRLVAPRFSGRLIQMSFATLCVVAAIVVGAEAYSSFSLA